MTNQIVTIPYMRLESIDTILEWLEKVVSYKRAKVCFNENCIEVEPTTEVEKMYLEKMKYRILYLENFNFKEDDYKRIFQINGDNFLFRDLYLNGIYNVDILDETYESTSNEHKFMLGFKNENEATKFLQGMV